MGSLLRLKCLQVNLGLKALHLANYSPFEEDAQVTLETDWIPKVDPKKSEIFALTRSKGHRGLSSCPVLTRICAELRPVQAWTFEKSAHIWSRA